MKNKNQKLVFIIILVFITLASASFTYAYFSAGISGNEEAETQLVTAGTLSIEFKDGPQIGGTNIIPGTSYNKKMVVKNTGTLSTHYNMGWKILINEIVNGEMEYSLSCTSYSNYINEGNASNTISGSCDSITNRPIDGSNLISNVSINDGITHVYNLIIDFKETNSPQNYNQGKRFNGVINVNEDNMMLSNIKNTLDTITDFSNATPYLGDIVRVDNIFLSNYDIQTDKEYLYNINSESLYSISGEKYNDITYYTDKEYRYLTSPNGNEIDKGKLIELKYYYINRLKSSQIRNGAFPSYNVTDTNVNPYFAETISLSLNSDMNSLKNVRDYLVWHFNHINVIEDVNGKIGTIYDYTINRDTLAETHSSDYDSEDSYAALLYIVLYKYYKASNDVELFNTYKDKIELSINSLNSVYNDTYNLTYAKSTYQVFYAMDNFEVVEGYKNLANIYKEIYNDNEKYNQYMSRYNIMKTAVYNYFYNESENMFDWAYNAPSASAIGTTFYPNVTAQFYSMYYDIVSPQSELGKHLYYLSTYYGSANHLDWYNYDDIMVGSPVIRYSNNVQLITALMMDSTITTDGTTINVKNEVTNAFNTLYDLSKTTDQYMWYLGEDANSLLALEKYFDNIINDW